MSWPSNGDPDYRFPLALERRQRIVAALIASLLLGMLGLARVLTPNPSGVGTHQQLGLPPCTFAWFFGIRCPTCGMTTSWANLVRGDPLAAWNSNPGGTCLACFAALFAAWALWIAIRGQYRPLLSSRTVVTIAVIITAITLTDWFQRVF